MRNLKRALSLALSSAMVLGMMVMGAGAVSYNDFGDKDEIVNKDAVSMVTALGIINGLPSGDYGPTQNIDRASFVKMVCLTLNGGAEPVLPASTKANYVDTAGTWAESYIEYCTNLGIAAGDGTTGKFNPTANVTVSQAAKMLLVALGYNASIEGYVGMDWQMNVDVAANLAGLYKGISGSTSAPATRDQAAQMIYNALDAVVVQYNSSFEVDTNGQVTARPQVVNNPNNLTLLEQKFEAVKVVVEIVGNDYAAVDGGSTTNKDKTRVVIVEQPRSNIVSGTLPGQIGTNEVKDGTYSVASTPDMLGQTATMFVRMSGGSTAPAKTTVLGNLVLTEDNKIVTLSSQKKEADDVKDFLKGESLSWNDDSKWVVNYDAPSKAIPVGNADDDTNYTNPKGAVVTLIDNDGNGKVDYALQSIKTFGQVNAYSTLSDGSIYVGNINWNGYGMEYISNNDAKDEVNGFGDVALDDYVLFYEIGVGTEKDIYVEKAKYVDVTVTAIRGDKVTADGKTYEASTLVTGFGEDEDTLGKMVDLKDEVRLYMDEAGFVVYTDSVNVSNDYLLVTGSNGFSTFDGSIRAKVVFADGTSSTITIEDSKDEDGNWELGLEKDEELAETIYSYSVNSKGIYTIEAVDDGDLDSDGFTGSGKITKGKPALVNGIIANNSTIFVVQRSNSGTYSVYTGINNVPTLDNVDATILHKDKVAKVVFVQESDLAGEKEGIYVLDANPYITSNSDGDKLYTYDVVYNGEKTELTYDSSKSPFVDGSGDPQPGYYKEVEVVGSEIVKPGTYVAKAEAIKASKGVIQATGGAAYTYTDDTVFLVVDGTDVSTVSVGVIIANPEHDAKIDGSMIVIIPSTESGMNNVADTVIICK